jgi:hypothetical protein
MITSAGQSLRDAEDEFRRVTQEHQALVAAEEEARKNLDRIIRESTRASADAHQARLAARRQELVAGILGRSAMLLDELMTVIEILRMSSLRK